MNKYLIFRTDRIGDFLLSLILIKSIKRNDPNSHITLVSSEKNYEYIKSFKEVNNVILLKKNFFSKFKTFFLLNKSYYKSVIIHDTKKRSRIISQFLKSENKYFPNEKITSHLYEIKKILNSLNFYFDDIDLNVLDSRPESHQKYQEKGYILFHFDEKWIFDEYVNNYINIEPSEDDLEFFLNSLALKSNKRIIVTTGVQTPKLLINVFNKKLNHNIKLIENLNFINLEGVVNNCSMLISCHGAISHIAAAKNIKQIDIVDKSYNYKLWTDHFRNYNFINRSNFKDLSKNIFDLL